MVSGNPRPYSNATNENEKIAIDRLYSGEGGWIHSKTSIGLESTGNQDRKTETNLKKTVFEEAGKCIETRSKVKRLGCNRVRWRCFTNTDTMPGHMVSEVISAQVSESILSDKKEDVCECCEIIKLELNEMKLKLSSCKEILRVLRGKCVKLVRRHSPF